MVNVRPDNRESAQESRQVHGKKGVKATAYVPGVSERLNMLIAGIRGSCTTWKTFSFLWFVCEGDNTHLISYFCKRN